MSQTDNERWQGLAALARALGGSARVRDVLEVASEELLSALGADSVSVSRLEPGTWTLRTLINAGALGPDEQHMPTDEVYRLEEFAHFSHVYRDQRVWVASSSDPDVDPAELNLLSALGKGSSLTAPIVVDNVLWGELYATWFSPIGAVAAMHDGYLEALTAILGGAISRALETETLEELAFRDPLTGLANRRSLDIAADEAFRHVKSGSARRVSVVAADINGLKMLNDAAGHQHGDALIRSVANLLVHHFNPLYGSLTARVGGDEFAVLVPGHPLDSITTATADLCRDARELPGSDGVSCGVASVIVDGAGGGGPSALFSAADTAMYRAKRERRQDPVVARDR